MIGHLILGDQLFPQSHWKLKGPVFMAEDYELCTHFKYHKHKIIFFLASMRQFASELEEQKVDLEYSKLEKKQKPFIDRLEAWLKKKKITELHGFEIDDEFFETRVVALCRELKITLKLSPTPKFLTTRDEFKAYLADTKKPFMKVFYERQRKKTGMLMDPKGKPLGGKFSFDEDNRKKLPKDLTPPALKKIETSVIVEDVKRLVDEHFKDHPGDSKNFWLATSREDAKLLAADFFKKRLELFGDYEDALTPEHDYVFHSVLSPYMNNGFLPPELLLKQVPKLLEKDMPLNSIEGFVRQVMGWREFINGIYRNFNRQQAGSNFFKHERLLTRDWYQGTTGIDVLDDVIKKSDRLGFAHHIERLMVVSNIMLMSEIHPHEVYRYFMEMYVDSADWVMGPNVWGMGQFSDGGIFATKPYLCGSNYIRKMSHYKEGPWCDVMDGLYWRFMEKHREFFAKNMRMGAALGTLDKMDPARRKKIFGAAEKFIAEKTRAAL